MQCGFCLNFQLWTPRAIRPVVWNMTAVSWQKVARIASLQNTTDWDNSGSRWQLTIVSDVYRLLAWLYLQQRMMRWKLTQAFAGWGVQPSSKCIDFISLAKAAATWYWKWYKWIIAVYCAVKFWWHFRTQDRLINSSWHMDNVTFFLFSFLWCLLCSIWTVTAWISFASRNYLHVWNLPSWIHSFPKCTYFCSSSDLICKNCRSLNVPNSISAASTSRLISSSFNMPYYPEL